MSYYQKLFKKYTKFIISRKISKSTHKKRKLLCIKYQQKYYERKKVKLCMNEYYDLYDGITQDDLNRQFNDLL